MTESMPCNLAAEKAVLAAVILRRESLALVAGMLTAEDFYDPVNRGIYEAMLKLERAGAAIDPLTLDEQIRRSGGYAPQPGYLIELLDVVATADNCESHARLVAEQAAVRRVLKVAVKIRAEAMARPADVPGFLDESAAALSAAMRLKTTGEPKTLNVVLLETERLLERRQRRDVRGLQTGFGSLDEMLGGLDPGDLVILAARPSMGKSALAMNISSNVARAGNPVYFASLEMSEQQLGTRALSGASRIEINRLRRASDILPAEWAKIARSRAAMFQTGDRLFIDELCSPTITELRSRARRWALHAKAKRGLLVVDYLQRVRASGKNDQRERQISEISGGLKDLGKELGMPMLALAQLNRDLEKRDNKRPTNSDLRESGAIEQDADVILFIYRDEKYNPNTLKKGIAEVIVSKQRNGPVGTVELRWEDETTTFSNLTVGQELML